MNSRAPRSLHGSPRSVLAAESLLDLSGFGTYGETIDPDVDQHEG